LLGWQLGQRSLLLGVTKLPPATLVSLTGGSLELTTFDRAPRSEIGLRDAVEEAAELLRGYLNAYLDDHPDSILQLTGGQDSRLLLSAVAPRRRRGLRVVTLGLPGNPDVTIAGDLARREGMTHEVLTLAGLDEVEPHRADEMCLEAARRLEGMADPLAHAALTFVEQTSERGPRISGLGGEVARGFYYLGGTRDAPVTRRRVERLAAWRMFANESVPLDILAPELGRTARASALNDLEDIMASTGLAWPAATDDLYLHQRMQRWAGVTETAVCFDRAVVNPMLDDRFVQIANSLSPRDKQGSLFLSRLQTELDPELARIPLDGRPAPEAFASRSIANSARQAKNHGHQLMRKSMQRLRRAPQPPAGGSLLARKAVEHWRRNPESLHGLHDRGLLRADWIQAVLDGRVEPSPSAVALVTNLRVMPQTPSV
jgi:asparagine synthase (glutamine-hydrolysing)